MEMIEKDGHMSSTTKILIKWLIVIARMLLLLLWWLTMLLLLLPAMNSTVESWRMKILQPSVIAQKAIISRVERNDNSRRRLVLLLLLQRLRIGWLSFRHRPEYREVVLDLLFYFWMV